MIRPRRLRINANIRAMVEETNLSLSDFIYPLFIKHGKGEKKEISSMPGQYQMTLDFLEQEIKEIKSLGLKSVLLFGIPQTKDACGSDNYNPNGIVPQAIRAIKEIAPEIVVVSDMCFCEYTDHGHCGVINSKTEKHYNENLPQGYLLNDETLELLAKATLIHAQAGADIIAPSGMIDNMIGTLRECLDENRFEHTILMSYAAKYASSFYGPFREAAQGSPQFGNRSQYQMDPKNSLEALREVEIDIQQGADIVMVKPALSYLDIISRVKDTFNVPVAAYNVSGEYSMIHAAAKNNWLDYRQSATEMLTSIKRAGAKIIITYFAKDIAKWLNE